MDLSLQGFTTEQLVELAGLSVAHAVVKFLTTTKESPREIGDAKLLVVGGLVYCS
jgi:hypothetical protein